MDVTTYSMELERMCKTYPGCMGCPASTNPNSIFGECIADTGVTSYHPGLLLRIVEKWSAEHSAKTRLQDLLEKHPHAYIASTDYPTFAPCELGYCGETTCSFCEYTNAGDKCWDLPVEE